MKTSRQAHSDSDAREPVASTLGRDCVAVRGSVQGALGTLVNGSPRAAAQRRQLVASFGPAMQRRVTPEEEALHMRALPDAAQRRPASEKAESSLDAPKPAAADPRLNRPAMNADRGAVADRPSAALAAVVQREPYLDLRGVGGDYTGLNDERVIQRPGLINAIMVEVEKLRQADRDYEDRRLTATFAELQVLIAKRDKLYRFLRKQDVDVDQQGNLTPGSLVGRLVEYDTTPAQQDATLVNIAGGQLQRNDGLNTPVDTKDSVTFQTGEGWEIFVMDPEGNLHMTSHKIGKRHHSSMLAGGETSAAGSIKATGGYITHLNNKSGHYTPRRAQMRQALHKLQKSGVALNFQLKILGTAADAFDGLASDFMKPVSAGGLGQLDAFEVETTTRILHHFINTKGAPAVAKVFTDMGWNYNTLMGRIVIVKDTGAVPSHEEVRDILRAHFAERGPVTVTKN